MMEFEREELPIILCVDDDELTLRSLSRSLRNRFQHRCTIETSNEASEALKLVEQWDREQQTLAVVISDLKMPEMMGDEFLVTLHRSHPEVVKILLTGVDHVTESIVNAINNADLYRYMTKPWAEEDLALTIEQGLQKFSLVSRLKHKVAEQTRELRQQHDSLREHHEQLKQAQAQLVQSEKIAALGILLTGVAHEIKNPAQFAYSGAQNMRRRLEQLRSFLLTLAGDDAEPELLDLLKEKFLPLFQNMDAILDGTHRIQLLASNLHAFSRLSSNEERQLLQVSHGLKSTLTLVEANFRESVEFSLELDYDPELYGSTARLNQVFMNLIVNACQAIVEKRNTLERTAPGHLRIRTYEGEDSMLVIEFKDDGVGISPSHLQQIFQPFFSTKPEGQGTGLGLSISTSIIEEHKGKIEVHSIVDQGTEMRVFLPVHTEEEI